MNSSDFEFVAGLLRKRAGIVLGVEKSYLIESRLGPLARRENLPSIADLVQVVRSRREERLISQLVDVMTTSETSFFRDRTPFAHLKQSVLPELAQARRGSRIRIWCAACSTGQEPYSIAMMLDQNPEILGGVPVEIIASDISERSLERARAGLFTQFEVQRGLPIGMLMQHFTQSEDSWRISERLRASIAFRRHNLMEQSQLGMFDVVMLRNCINSFDQPTRSEVLGRVASQMNAGGYLILGAAETAQGVTDAFNADADRRGLWRPARREVKAA